MAQIEFAGIKFTGGKMAIVITLVTSLIGGLWGGFEVYKDYMDMKEKIQSYTAPDLSGIDKRIAVLENELTFVSDLKTDIKSDVRRIESIVNDVEQRVKEDSRSNTKDLNETIKQIEDDMEKLENKVIKQIQTALENPLSNMK